MNKDKQIRLFDRQAVQYDKKREGAAQQQWRRKLLSHANGAVLELSVGAGANFPYYRSDVKLTAVDFSAEMLSRAKQAVKRFSLQAEFILSDIEELELAEHSFDTVVSTLSLCSYENPLRILHNISRWCRPGGTILLMEHGISSNKVVSILLNALDPLLFRTVGCHHNRNILGLISHTDISIQQVESHWMGMIHLIWAKPSKPE